MQDNISKCMVNFDKKKEKKKLEIPVFPHDVSTSGSPSIATQSQYEMLFNFFEGQMSYALANQLELAYSTAETNSYYYVTHGYFR
jgi:hypothetical protein